MEEDKGIRYDMTMGMLGMVAHLPLGVLYVVSGMMAFVLHRLVRYRVRVVRSNLRKAFPSQTPKALRHIERQYYRHLCDCIVETVKLLHITDEELHRRVEVRNGDLVEKMAEDGTPIFLMLGHYGNWEWVQQITRHYSRPTTNSAIYRPVKDPVFNAVMKKVRSRFDTIQIPQKQAVRQLIGWTREHRQYMVGFIADQRPNSRNLNHWTTFLGLPTAIAVGAEEIGRHVGARYVYLDIECKHRGYYRMTFRPLMPAEDVVAYPYMTSFMRMLEASIRRAPQHWLWSHKRWSVNK